MNFETIIYKLTEQNKILSFQLEVNETSQHLENFLRRNKEHTKQSKTQNLQKNSFSVKAIFQKIPYNSSGILMIATIWLRKT